MAAELSRLAAFAASRPTSSSLLRGSVTSFRHCNRLLATNQLPTPTARQLSTTAPRRVGWESPIRGPPPRVKEASDFNIRKPNVAAYDSTPRAYGAGGNNNNNNNDKDWDHTDYAKDLDLELGDLKKDTDYGLGPPAQPLTHPLYCVPRLGRSVEINKSVDVGRAFKLVERGVAVNKTRTMVRLQKEHERPGLKRKRLKSERWQRRFKYGFRFTVKRVRELTNQGW